MGRWWKGRRWFESTGIWGVVGILWIWGWSGMGVQEAVITEGRLMPSVPPMPRLAPTIGDDVP
jgi:hypothetical protein